MARNSKVTEIYDRYELKFVIFHRDGSDLGRIYHQPSHSSKVRFARAISNLHEQKRVRIYNFPQNTAVYLYEPIYKKR